MPLKQQDSDQHAKNRRSSGWIFPQINTSKPSHLANQNAKPAAKTRRLRRYGIAVRVGRKPRHEARNTTSVRFRASNFLQRF